MTHNVGRLPSSRERDARSVRTQAALRDALLALLNEKPFEQITVREITLRAGVHYATFFRHHPATDALLDRVAADQMSRLVAMALGVLAKSSSDDAIASLFTYVDQNRALWTALLTGGAAGAMRAELLRLSQAVALGQASVPSGLPMGLAVSCAVGLVFETLAWWLAPAQTAVLIEEVTTILSQLLAPFISL